MAEVPVAFCMYKFTFTFNHHLGTSFMYQLSFQVAGKNKNKVKLKRWYIIETPGKLCSEYS